MEMGMESADTDEHARNFGFQNGKGRKGRKGGKGRKVIGGRGEFWICDFGFWIAIGKKRRLQTARAEYEVRLITSAATGMLIFQKKARKTAVLLGFGG